MNQEGSSENLNESFKVGTGRKTRRRRRRRRRSDRSHLH